MLTHDQREVIWGEKEREGGEGAETERDRERQRQRPTDRQTDRQTDGRTDRQTKALRDRQKQRQTETETEIKTRDGETVRLTAATNPHTAKRSLTFPYFDNCFCFCFKRRKSGIVTI